MKNNMKTRTVLTASLLSLFTVATNGLLAPASNTQFSLSTSDGNNYLSIAAMMLIMLPCTLASLV